MMNINSANIDPCQMRSLIFRKAESVDPYSQNFEYEFLNLGNFFRKIRYVSGAYLPHDDLDTDAYLYNYGIFSLFAIEQEVRNLDVDLSEYSVIDIGGQRGLSKYFLPKCRSYISIDRHEYLNQKKNFPDLCDEDFICDDIFSLIYKSKNIFKNEKTLIVFSNVLNEFDEDEVDSLFYGLYNINPHFEFIIIESQRKFYRLEKSVWIEKYRALVDSSFRLVRPKLEIENHYLQREFKYRMISSLYERY